MMFADSIAMTTTEQAAHAAWIEYATAVEAFSQLVTDGASRHDTLRQHEKVIRTEIEWKRAYCALLIPAERLVQ